MLVVKDKDVRRINLLFSAAALAGFLRYVISRSQVPFSGAGDNLLLRDFMKEGGLDWPKCLTAGRFRPATYCDLLVQKRLGVFDNAAVEALVFSALVAVVVVVGWLIAEVLLERRLIKGDHSWLIGLSVLTVAFSPVWSYSVTADYANMELFGTAFFLLAVLFQCRAVKGAGGAHDVVLAIAFASISVLWHERYVVALVSVAVSLPLFFESRHCSPTRARVLRLGPPAVISAVLLAYASARFLAESAPLVSFGGESATTMSSFLSVSSLGRLLLALVLMLSPVHFSNYMFEGGLTTPTLVGPAVFSAVALTLVLVWPLFWQAYSGLPRRRGSWAATKVLLVNFALLALVVSSVEERLELRWLAAPTALAVPLVMVGFAEIAPLLARKWHYTFALAIITGVLVGAFLEPRSNHYLLVGGELADAQLSTASLPVPVCLSPEVPEAYLQWVTGYGRLGRFALADGPPCLAVRFPAP